jgi:predicted transcriptional regulator
MTANEKVDTLLGFFKALSDANRLKIVALLAQEPLSVEQLAEMLDLNSSTVSHHLAKLSKAGLVTAKAESYYNVYQLELKTLSTMAQTLLAEETLPAVAAEVDTNAYDQKVLNTYLTPEGRIKAIPAQLKKQEAILRHVVEAFETGREYTEKEVNEILLRFNEDVAYLRRALIDFKFMGRENGGRKYWRQPN